MTAHSTVIRNGTIIDGTGGDPVEADLAIDGATITAVGKGLGRGREEIDARGLLVTPGFVDVHTHYDCQVTWDTRLIPSSYHGITTVIMGNCAVGVAPCRPKNRELLAQVIEGVEDIPEAVMTAGVPWSWETFPEYLDFLDGRRMDVDFATQIAHSAIRVYVMGARAGAREMSTGPEQAQMTQLVTEAIRVGALGVSTSRTGAHRTIAGQLAPAETCSEAELLALARGLREAGTGVFELICDFTDLEAEDSADFNLLRRIVAASGGRPLSYSLFELGILPNAWRRLLALTAKANADGLPIRAQVMPRANGIIFGLTASYHPFSFHPSYRAIAARPLAERVATMRDASFKAKVLAEQPNQPNRFLLGIVQRYAHCYVLGNPPDYEQPPERVIGQRAAALGIDPLSLTYDLLLDDDGKRFLYLPTTNYVEGSLDHALEMMQHDNTILGLGDGGAHYGMICDASYSTYTLSHWVRDRHRGARVPLPWAVQALTQKPASAMGLLDRGVIAPGYKADINIIDLDKLHLPSPDVMQDLPGGASRMVQRATGYTATLVSGALTYRNGEPTDALPGRLIRGARPKPQF